MITVNLKDLYYWCKEDMFVEITEEMLEAMKDADRQESTYKRRTYRYKAHYTLDMVTALKTSALSSRKRGRKPILKRKQKKY